MKKHLILALYILLFWIILPGILVLSARWFDNLFGIRSIKSLPGGFLILCFALPLLAISIIQFRTFSGKYPVSADPPERFIRKGLYAVWRHPIYLFYTLALIGIALLWGSGGMLLISIPVFMLLEGIYIVLEERTLVRRYGKAYVNYRHKTPLVVPRFYFWLKIPCFLLFGPLFSYRALGKENIPDAPPFFLISSHRNYLDPFFLGQAFPFTIRNVTTFEMYRSRKIRWFFRALDCIPKKRYLHDISTGREMLKAISQDAVIGIFPEGERGWTGTMQSLKPETINLFRKFSHIPILPVKLQGNFFEWPRWGSKPGRAPVTVEYLEPIHISKEWDQEEIAARLTQAIDPDDLNHPDVYCRSKRRMKDISRVIYRCPLCKTFDSIVLTREGATCSNCRAVMEMDERYYLTCSNEKMTIRNSLEEIRRNLKVNSNDLENLSDGTFPGELERLCSGDEKIIAYSEHVEVSSESIPRMERLFTGPVMLTTNRLVFAEDPGAGTISLASVSSVTTESNYKLQVYDNSINRLYQLVFGRESVLKWQDLIAAVIENEFGRTPNLR
ncbi:MAG: 1-acyl-sn-glycerol-3-phosphate acyltransferase [Bacteroidales bacterium]